MASCLPATLPARVHVISLLGLLKTLTPGSAQLSHRLLLAGSLAEQVTWPLLSSTYALTPEAQAQVPARRGTAPQAEAQTGFWT